MASRFAERSIPHIRDIFGLSLSSASRNAESRLAAAAAVAGTSNGVPKPSTTADNVTGANSKQQGLKCNGQGSDSAISVDSSEEEFNEDGRRGRRKSRRGRDTAHKRGSSACTRREVADEDEEEFRHLERHLSMKKTIRKRIMRELQGAMVEDPSEFCAERRSAAISAHSLTFRRRRGAPPPLPKDLESESAAAAPSVAVVEQPGFLDMLRLADHDADSGNDSPTRPSPQESRESSTTTPMAGGAVVNKRHIYDSYRQMSSFRLAMPDDENSAANSSEKLDNNDASNNAAAAAATADKSAQQQPGNSKKSFWKRIMKNSNKTSKR